MEIRKEMLVGWPAPAMFDLIEQAEGYPEFLPWCASSTILERSDDVVAATINVDYRGVRFSFSTRNPKRRPEWLQVQLISGPFRRFEGEWQLVPLGDAGCRVTFMLRYEFDSTLMKRLAAPVFDRIADTLLDALVTHADRRFVDTPPPADAAATPAPMPRPAPAAAAEPADAAPAPTPAAEPIHAAPAPAPATEPIHAAPTPAPAAVPADAAPAPAPSASPSPSPEPSTRSSA